MIYQSYSHCKPHSLPLLSLSATMWKGAFETSDIYDCTALPDNAQHIHHVLQRCYNSQRVKYLTTCSEINSLVDIIGLVETNGELFSTL